MSKLKPIPVFKSEAEERKFWETHDSTDYLDWSKARRMIFPNLTSPTKSISMRRAAARKLKPKLGLTSFSSRAPSKQ